MNDREIQWLEKLSRNPYYKMSNTQKRKLEEYHQQFEEIEIKQEVKNITEKKSSPKKRKKTTGKKKTVKNVIEIDEKITGLLEES